MRVEARAGRHPGALRGVPVVAGGAGGSAAVPSKARAVGRRGMSPTDRARPSNTEKLDE